MILVIDRAFAVLLIIGAMGHSLGVTRYYKGQPDPLFWSLCTSVLIVLVAAVNLLRSARANDRLLAWLAAVSSAAYMAISICFGFLVGNPYDVRAVSFALVSLGLTLLGIRQATRHRPE